MRKLLIFLGLFVLSFLISSCNKSNNNVKVTFISDGEVYETLTVTSGEIVSEPFEPIKDSDEKYEYEFKGWFDGDTKWDFNDPVLEDITLTAKFSEKAIFYTVKFFNENNNLIKEEKIAYGTPINKPSIPEREGYVGQWLGEDYNTMPSKNISYKIHYEAEKYYANLIFDDKEVKIEYTILNRNEKLEEIKDLLKQGDLRFEYDWQNKLPNQLPLSNSTYTFDKQYKASVETFDNVRVIENDKQLEGIYKYYSNSSALFPLSITNSHELLFEISKIDSYGVLSIDLGEVNIGETYQIIFDVEMYDDNNNLITNGFAYALGTTKGASTGSFGTNGILQIYSLLNKNGTFTITFTAASNASNLFLLLRSQKNYSNSYLKIDNLVKVLKEHEVSQYLFGVGEPLRSSNVNEFNQDMTIDLVGMLNAKSYRMWFGVDIFEGWTWDSVLDTFAISEANKKIYDQILEKLAKAGVKEVTGMGHYLPVTSSTTSSSGNEYYVPMIGSTDYQVFLDKIYEIWYMMALTFPQITVWEVGNETNNTHYLRYKDYEFMSYSEMAKINVDMLYYAYQGIKKANPNAMVITPGFAPVTSYYNSNTNDESADLTKLNNGIDSIEVFLKLMYQNISSNNFPYHNNSLYIKSYDNNPDHYFDGLAWHPYDLGKEGYANTNDPNVSTFDVNLWVEANNRCYKVMCDNGDSNKEVWFTEFGLTTKSSNLVYSLTSSNNPYEYYIYFEGGTVNYKEGNTVTSKKVSAGYYYINFKDYETYGKNQEYFIREYFKAMESSKMKYIHACHFFRMFSSSIDYTWNGLTVLYYGIFTEANIELNRGYYPTKKAYVIQDIYGGVGDLMKYHTYNSVHTGDIEVSNNAMDDFSKGSLTGLSGNAVKYKGNFYAYSSNNNGTFTLNDGVLTMTSTVDSFIAFKLNKFEKGKTYTIYFDILDSESNTAFIIYSSSIKDGKWDSSSRLPLFDSTYSAVMLNKLTKNGNTYSYTFTANENYESLYFTFRNTGTISFDSIKVEVK